MPEPARPQPVHGPRHRARWRPLVSVVLLFALVACGAPGGGGGSGADFGAGEVARGAEATLHALDDAFEGRVDLVFEAAADPSADHPLPAGVGAAGVAVHVSATPTLATTPATPFLLTLPVPSGVDPDGLAIALLETDGAYAPKEDGSPVDGRAWVVLQTFYDPVDARLVAPVLQVPPDGWTAMVVRVDGGATPPVATASAIVAPAQTMPGVRGRCGPGYAAAVETCGTANLDALAASLADAMDELTGLGFSDDPKLEREVVVVRTAGIVGFAVFLGDYLIEMRPASTANAGGMFSPGSGRVWVAVGVGGVDDGDRSTVRHEYVHATQNGYGTNFASNAEQFASLWSLEGQATLLQTNYGALARRGDAPRSVETTLRRNAWNGTVFTRPLDEYQAQDFWMYLAQRFEHDDATFLEPFMERGQRAQDVDATLRDAYPAAFGAAGSAGGLGGAYWGWVRDHLYEHRFAPDPAVFGPTCSFLAATANPIVVALDGSAASSRSVNLDPLASRVFRLDGAASAAGFEQAIALSANSTAVRAALYVGGGAGGSACIDAPARRDWLWPVPPEGARAYLLVANTDFVNAQPFTVAFEGLTIAAPSGPVPEGSIGFRAIATLGGDVDVSWSYEPLGGGVPFFFGPSALGATVQQTICDGSYAITATARRGTTTVASASTTLVVTDTGNATTSGPCAPSVAITAPEAGSTRAAGELIGLRAEVATGGATTYPVVWRNAATNAIVATGADTSASFAAGPVTLEVSYGAATATVSFTAVAQDPPTATILTPADGAFFPRPVDEFVATSVDFAGLGFAGSGDLLPAEGLAWSYRRVGSSTWTPAGTGATTTIAFPYSGSLVNQGWEVRFIATEGSLTSEPDVIGITVQRFPD